MNRSKTIFLVLSFVSSLAFGLVGCDKSKDTNEPDDGIDNLCAQYTSCDACIAGQQTEGHTEGEAESQCALAVTGCWTTWDKPVTCGADVYEEQPEAS